MSGMSPQSRALVDAVDESAVPSPSRFERDEEMRSALEKLALALLSDPGERGVSAGGSYDAGGGWPAIDALALLGFGSAACWVLVYALLRAFL